MSRPHNPGTVIKILGAAGKGILCGIVGSHLGATAYYRIPFPEVELGSSEHFSYLLGRNIIGLWILGAYLPLVIKVSLWFLAIPLVSQIADLLIEKGIRYKSK